MRDEDTEYDVYLSGILLFDSQRRVSTPVVHSRLIEHAWTGMEFASGALWAKILWGTYWGWDPVETWSLASFVVYGLYVHLRLIFGWRMRRAAWFALFAVIPVMISFWGVGLMMTSRHLFQLMDMVR